MIDPAEALDALLDELRRRKAAGERVISVSAESLNALRVLAGAPAAKPSVTEPVRTTPAPVAPVRREAVASVVPRPVVKVVAKPAVPAAPIPEPPVFTLPAGSKAERMTALAEIIGSCAETRRHLEPGHKPVLGHGSPDARVLFVGEAPSLEEAEAGRPFVGPSGEMLRKIFGAASFREEDVYLASLMTWRPEPPTAFGKRPPTAREIAFNLPYLRAQIEIVRPQVIVALGAQALEALLPEAPKITVIRGQWLEYGGTPLLPTFHPNYILHNPSNSIKRVAWEDFMLIMGKLGLPISDKQRAYFAK